MDLGSQNWTFCFIGGLALQRWGESRLTREIDLTIVASFGREREDVGTLLAGYPARRDDAREFALQYREVP